jgi:hypothetical protein
VQNWTNLSTECWNEIVLNQFRHVSGSWCDQFARGLRSTEFFFFVVVVVLFCFVQAATGHILDLAYNCNICRRYVHNARHVYKNVDERKMTLISCYHMTAAGWIITWANMSTIISLCLHSTYNFYCVECYWILKCCMAKTSDSDRTRNYTILSIYELPKGMKIWTHEIL